MTHLKPIFHAKKDCRSSNNLYFDNLFNTLIKTLCIGTVTHQLFFNFYSKMFIPLINFLSAERFHLLIRRIDVPRIVSEKKIFQKLFSLMLSRSMSIQF